MDKTQAMPPFSAWWKRCMSHESFMIHDDMAKTSVQEALTWHSSCIGSLSHGTFQCSVHDTQQQMSSQFLTTDSPQVTQHTASEVNNSHHLQLCGGPALRYQTPQSLWSDHSLISVSALRRHHAVHSKTTTKYLLTCESWKDENKHLVC